MRDVTCNTQLQARFSLMMAPSYQKPDMIVNRNIFCQRLEQTQGMATGLGV